MTHDHADHVEAAATPARDPPGDDLHLPRRARSAHGLSADAGIRVT
jgi:hypothetical protein